MQLRIFRHGLAEGFFLGHAAGHDGRVLQAGQSARAGFAAVGHAVETAFRPAGVLLAPLAEGAVQQLPAAHLFERIRQRLIAEKFEVRDGVQPVGMGRIADDEHQFVFLRTGRAPGKEIFRFGRLAVFVNAEEAHIQIEARILEVVGIAAEEGDILLGREDQPHVGVFFEAVEVVQPARGRA